METQRHRDAKHFGAARQNLPLCLCVSVVNLRQRFGAQLDPSTRQEPLMSDATLRPIERALISVYDKTGLLPLAQALAARGVEILSTGGTARALTDSGIKVTDVAAETRFP